MTYFNEKESTEMKNSKESYAITESGSINYEFYDQRSKNIRSESIVKLFKGMFSSKKHLTSEALEDCDVLSFNRSTHENYNFKTIRKAA